MATQPKPKASIPPASPRECYEPPPGDQASGPTRNRKSRAVVTTVRSAGE